MKVTVGDQQFTLVESGDERWEVFGDGPDPLGQVWKGTRTWSPSAAGFGGRIVRFHKKVQCWKATGGYRDGYETRKQAIQSLQGRS